MRYDEIMNYEAGQSQGWKIISDYVYPLVEWRKGQRQVNLDGEDNNSQVLDMWKTTEGS
jgi:hypothetical protein